MRSPRSLAVVLLVVASPALAQDDDSIVEIPDVEVPDVRVGANDRVLEERLPPPPVAVFEPPLPEVAQREAAQAPAATSPIAVAPAGTQVTGSISAIDLDDGSLEVETDTQGTLRIRADRSELRQLTPGQSISLSYVDRRDGRWASELERLPPAEPTASEPTVSEPTVSEPTASEPTVSEPTVSEPTESEPAETTTTPTTER